jgi:hypothetical protein
MDTRATEPIQVLAATQEPGRPTGSSFVSAEASSVDELQAAKDLGVSQPVAEPRVPAPERVTESASSVAHDVPEMQSGRVTQSASVAERDIAAPQPAPANPAPRAKPEPTTASSLALPSNSDLVMVETRFAAPVVESEVPAAPRPRRERRPSTPVPDEPLQMVETRKDQPSP